MQLCVTNHKCHQNFHVHFAFALTVKPLHDSFSSEATHTSLTPCTHQSIFVHGSRHYFCLRIDHPVAICVSRKIDINFDYHFVFSDLTHTAMASFPMSSGSSSFGGLGRSHIGSNAPGLQSDTTSAYRGTSLRRFSMPPNFTFASRIGRTPEGQDGRHGSGARPNRTSSRDADRRERSQSRRSDLREGETIIRSMPSGPQEAMDWASALDTVVNNIATLDRLVRTHAHSISDNESRIGALEQQVSFTATQAESTTKNFHEACENIVKWYPLKENVDHRFSKGEESFHAIYGRIAALETQITSLLHNNGFPAADSSGGPLFHSMATPSNGQTRPEDKRCPRGR